MWLARWLASLSALSRVVTPPDPLET